MKSRRHKYKMSICLRVTNPYSILFHIVGIACIIWFVLRVLPAPHRVRYPCQQISMTVALSYIAFWSILWSALFHGLAFWIRKVKTKIVVFTPIILISFVIIFFTISIVYADIYIDKKNEITRWDPLSKEPIGIPQGYNPGRVVWRWNPNATEKNLDGYWWEKENNNQTIIDQMFSSGIQTLAGVNDNYSAWDALFKYFNQKHGHGDVGYQADEVIAIKINLNNCESYNRKDNERDASPYVVKALLSQLVNTVNVAQEDIIIYEASRPIANWFNNRVYYEEYPTNHLIPEFPDVHYVDSDGGDSGREKVVASTERVYFAAGSCSYRTLPTCVVEADYLINIPLLKRHPLNNGYGVTLSGKNMFGTWIEDVSPIHSYHESGHILGNPAPQTDLLAHKQIGGKTLLYIGDGMYGTLYDHETIGKFQLYPFNDDWTNSLFFSQDPVAIDSVMYDFLHAEGTNPSEGSQNYLHQAAEPPSNVYDSEGDGEYLSDSLGVHEHWDTSIDIFSSERYSGPDGNGIDFIGLTQENIPPTADGNGPYSGYINEQITFDASGSTDSDGTITGYRWDFDGDEVYDTGWLSSSSITYTYTVTRTYNVILQVRDNYGAKDNDTTTVVITEEVIPHPPPSPTQPPPIPPPSDDNDPPSADANGPYYEVVGIPLRFDGFGSTDDGTIKYYEWNFGDGNTGTGESKTHTYKKEGNYTVKLTVTDDEGVKDTDTTFAVISGLPNNPPKTPTIDGPQNLTKNMQYSYIIEAIDIDNDDIRYVIDWGDGDNITTEYFYSGTIYNANHTWNIGGIYTIKVYAEDEFSRSDIVNLKVYVDISIIFIEDEIQGYLIDSNNDGNYDTFYNNSTGDETNVEIQIDGTYLINSNLDEDWEYIFDLEKNTLTPYSILSEEEKTEDNILWHSVIIIIIIIFIVVSSFIKKGITKK